ncbi:MAG: single-stranded DNA-binding protein [Methylococcales bacterium]
MIYALVSGMLIRDPVTRIGASGKSFTNFLLIVPIGEEQPAIISGIAFGDAAERVAKLKKGDALAVTGSLKPSSWPDKTTGEIKHGLSITAQACLSPYDVKKQRGGDQDNTSGRTKNSGVGTTKSTQQQSNFNDELPFD